MASIRPAMPDDASVLAELILELAEYEKLRHEAKPSVEALRHQLSTDAQPRCEALLAEVDGEKTAGFALFFHNYSTFLTNFGLYLEDLYVRPDYRGQGIGFALLQRIAQIAEQRGCQRLDWAVLDWNTPALRFYEQLGAEPLDDWTTMRLSRERIEVLAATVPDEVGT